MSGIDEIRAERMKKRVLLEEAGMSAYPAESGCTHTIKEAEASFDTLSSEGASVTLCGRVMSLRRHGGVLFADLFDGSTSERMQALLRKDDIGEASFTLFSEAIDQSDFIEVTGTLAPSRTGQHSLMANGWRVLAKSMQPVPDEHFGLKDEDERFRKRYLDILLNKEVRDMVEKRAQFWRTVREFMHERAFVEVETPVLETKTGGAEARPFATHHHALDIDVYLRISAGELWQKKLMVAGLPKVYEIGRIFRNEGMSSEHVQDYTQLEFYEAYADFKSGMETVRALFVRIAEEVFGTTKFSIRGHELDMAGEWQTYDYLELQKKHNGIDPLSTTLEEVRAKLDECKIGYDKKELSLERGVDMLWKRIRKDLTGPGFLINIPVYLEPLAKRAKDNPEVVERFQVMLAGSELGKGFSELNDPEDQRGRFKEQQALRDAGDDEAQMADWDFVEALEYGMPPTFGFGMSERLFAFLLDKPVREAQLFPLMRPRE